jgi:hypothetical protein
MAVPPPLLPGLGLSLPPDGRRIGPPPLAPPLEGDPENVPPLELDAPVPRAEGCGLRMHDAATRPTSNSSGRARIHRPLQDADQGGLAKILP